MIRKFNNPKLSINPTTNEEFEKIVHYFFSATEDHHLAMGVDKRMLGERSNWHKAFDYNLTLPDPEKDRFFITWNVLDVAIGHAQINRIKFGETACIHLHIWEENNRRLGFGTEFIKMSTGYVMERFRLKALLCEPYLKNPAPNKTLLSAGFKFVCEISPEPIPGNVNYKQPVNQYSFRV